MSLDIISEALQEAYASARDYVQIFQTVELTHSDWAAPFRAVLDTDSLTATLEAAAPFNPSTEVTFLPFQFDLQLPKVGETGRQNLTLTLDNVSLEIFDLLRSSDAANGAVHVIYREYVSTEMDKPGRIHQMDMKSFSVSAASVSATCVYADNINRLFPTLTYDQIKYPGLYR